MALDEFDMENVSALREHLRIPGMGLTTVRYFRDKLAMRARAKEAGILVPEFAHVLNYDDLREYMARVPAPWLLKPRSQASGIGMKKIHAQEELWPWLDQLGDQQSFYLLEEFLPGTRLSRRQHRLRTGSRLRRSPRIRHRRRFTTSHQGGVFTTSTLPPDTAETQKLLATNQQVLDELGLVRGVTHAEFLKADRDGKFYFLEIAARVGGAYISDVIEAATGINLWREWARLEVGAGKEPYTLPPAATTAPPSSSPSPARNNPTPAATTTPKSSTASANTTTPASSSAARSQRASNNYSTLTPHVSNTTSSPPNPSPTNPLHKSCLHSALS